VSTEEQASEGVSLASQRGKISAWADLNAYPAPEFYEDAGLSGKRYDNRPGLNAALDAACSRKAALVVYSLSRLARSVKDTISIGERLHSAGADLVSITEHIDSTTATGKMLFRMLAVLAEFERDQLSERVSVAMQHMRRNGQRIGSVPFGYSLGRDGKTLVENAEQRGILDQMTAMRERGVSYREISRWLNAQHVQTNRKAPWHSETVRQVLTRKPL